MRTPGVLLASALLGSLVGCGGPQPTATTDPGLVERPTGADELVLRVENRGGLQPPLERERQLPAMSIYGDGLVLVPKPVDLNFPDPAGYELDAFRIEAALLDDIVAAGVAVGLRQEDCHVAQEGPDFVADAGATTITLVAAAGRHVTGADALFDAADPDTAERTQLRDFVERLYGLRPADAALERHEPEAYRVYVAAPDPGFGPIRPSRHPSTGPSRMRWPSGATPSPRTASRSTSAAGSSPWPSWPMGSTSSAPPPPRQSSSTGPASRRSSRIGPCCPEEGCGAEA